LPPRRDARAYPRLRHYPDGPRLGPPLLRSRRLQPPRVRRRRAVLHHDDVGPVRKGSTHRPAVQLTHVAATRQRAEPCPRCPRRCSRWFGGHCKEGTHAAEVRPPTPTAAPTPTPRPLPALAVQHGWVVSKHGPRGVTQQVGGAPRNAGAYSGSEGE